MFLVVWSGTAFEEMARIIRFNPDRKHEFAAALRQLATELANYADVKGESREEEMRVMFAGELTVFFRVDVEDRTVEIGNVRIRRP